MVAIPIKSDEQASNFTSDLPSLCFVDIMETAGKVWICLLLYRKKILSTRANNCCKYQQPHFCAQIVALKVDYVFVVHP